MEHAINYILKKHTVLTDFNSFHPNLQFTKETEHDNKLNYLDLTVG